MLISGNGRGAGKTTFACELIRKFSNQMKITGIKISPHFHIPNEYAELIYADDDIIITREKSVFEGKDSSRMLRSGAGDVIYIRARDKMLHTAVMKLAPLWESRKPLICESGGLIHYLRPGLFYMLNRTGIPERKPAGQQSDLVDKWIDCHKKNFNIDAIGFSNNRWHLNNNKLPMK